MESKKVIGALVVWAIFATSLYFGSPISATHAKSLELTENFIYLPIIQRSPDPLSGLVYNDQQGMWLIDNSGNAEFLINKKNGMLSPDGSQIAYWFWEEGAGANDIWLADLLTGEYHNLTNSPDIIDREPQWWPAREGILIFGTNDEVLPSYGRLTMLDVDGTDYQVLDEQGFGPFALSPDGQTIAYISMYGNTGTFYNWDQGFEIFDPADYGIVVERMVNPVWSPDGQSIAWEVSGYFSSPDEWQIGVAVFDLNGKTSQLFHLYETDAASMVPHYLSWNPNGEWLAFVTWGEILEEPNQIVSPKGGPVPRLWLFRLDGQQGAHLGVAINPIWSPDGQQLVYQSLVEAPNDGIWLVDLLSWTKQQILPSGVTVLQWLEFDIEQ